MPGCIIRNGQTYESYTRKDIYDYLKKHCKGLNTMFANAFDDVIGYDGTIFVVKDIDGHAVLIKYDKKDEEKVQKVIDLIKKWDYCGAKAGAYCIEYELKTAPFRMWPRSYDLDSIIIICSGLYEKEHYIKQYTDGTNFKVTDL